MGNVLSEKAIRSGNQGTPRKLVSIDRASKIYKMDEVEVTALSEVSLEVERGEFIALVGPSGSGKTTLLNLVGLLDTPDTGDIYFEGQEVSTLSQKQRQQRRLNDFGFIFQEFNLIPSLTAIENVQLPLMFARKSDSEQLERATELLELVGLSKREQHLPSQLSGGERQRVAIARALANQPKLILADEPTGNLDSETANDVYELFRSLVDHNRAILTGTHNLELAKRADRTIFIRDGRIEQVKP